MNLNPVSSKLVTARYLVNGVWILVLLALAVAAGVWWKTWMFWLVGAVIAFACWLAWLIPAQVRVMGWGETSDELVITRGKLWHTLTVVPYGRIQFVDVTAGPIERWLGLKKLRLHTASAGTDATVKGLLAREADELRERLAEKARERMSGL